MGLLRKVRDSRRPDLDYVLINPEDFNSEFYSEFQSETEPEISAETPSENPPETPAVEVEIKQSRKGRKEDINSDA